MDYTPPDYDLLDLENETLPSQLDDVSAVSFDTRPVPFSPTSPGKRSPGRPKTTKEYEEDLQNLKSENYNLKVRIFFLEQSRFDPNLPKGVEEIRSLYNELKVEHEMQTKDLASKEDLLLNTYRALDALKQEIESLKVEHEVEKHHLQEKIDSLDKELKEYHLKFMETSLKLDDTHAMYCLTFGINDKQQAKKEGPAEDKIKQLESELAKEKERVLMLEQMVNDFNEKNDQECLQQVQERLVAMEQKIVKTLKEKDMYEKTIKEVYQKRLMLEQNIHTKHQAIKQKDFEIESLKAMVTGQEKELKSVKVKLQQREELAAEADSEIQKRLKGFHVENSKLKQEIKHLEQQLENRTPLRHLRERSTSRKNSEQDREQLRQLREAQIKIEELQKEIEDLKSIKTRYNHGNVEGLIQSLLKDNKLLKKEIEELKVVNYKLIGKHTESSKEEVGRNIDEVRKEMTSEKDIVIFELKRKIQELTDIINEKECKLREYKIKLESAGRGNGSINYEKSNTSLKNVDETLITQDKNEYVIKELEEKKKEVEILKKELRKRTFNLQGLVNTELWDKNREIEKLNKVCERQHLEVLALQKELREYQLNLVKNNVSSFVSPISLQNSRFVEDKENLQPDTMMKLQCLAEEKRELILKVEELEARLLNTPERDTESSLVQTLRSERDQADKQRKEAVNACVLLTTRLQELADFLDSLLPSLCGKKRKVVQQAVERSRELSRSLSLAAEDSTLHCSAWTDLQPSLYVPLLPDISTVDFWSGEESQEEIFSEGEQLAQLKSQVETLTEEVKQKDGEIAKLHSGRKFSESFCFKSGVDTNDYLLSNVPNSKQTKEDSMPYFNIADITEGSLVETCSDQTSSMPTKPSLEVKSSNIGKITLTSRKKNPNTSHDLVAVDISKPTEKSGCVSEYETWSEPDRDVSYARMGLKEDSASMNKNMQFKFDNTSETDISLPKSPASKRASETQRLQRKIHSLEQVNEALRSELVILHQLTPPAMTRQDKATSIEGDDQEKLAFMKLDEVTNQLESAESKLSELKVEKEQWNRKVETLQSSLQQTSNELIDKKCAMLELENSCALKIKELEDKYNQKCAETEQKCSQLEQQWLDLEKEKSQLLAKIAESDEKIKKLNAEIEILQQERNKDKKLTEDLNVQLQQMCRQKDDLQKVTAEQEQLLADAERERQELATQLIARDRQVSDLQKRLSHVELTSNELEAALRSQLDIATHQCAQFETKIRDLDNCKQKREDSVDALQRRLDSARFAHSEAVLQYTRVANENIKLQQELRRRHHEPNQIAQVEKIKSELERRVAELEVVNTELEAKLTSLNIVKPPYSDCETDGGSSIAGSPRRMCPPPLVLPSSPPHPSVCYTTQHSQDLTSDYLSDQDLALSSPQTQSRNMWFPTSPHSHASASPDLGIDSDHGRFSSLDNHAPKSSAVTLRGTPVNDLIKLEEENTQLRRNLMKTRHALEETLSQLTAANQHKRQYEAQLSAANQHKAKVERAICRQLYKTHSILKKARVNLEEDGQNE